MGIAPTGKTGGSIAPLISPCYPQSVIRVKPVTESVDPVAHEQIALARELGMRNYGGEPSSRARRNSGVQHRAPMIVSAYQYNAVAFALDRLVAHALKPIYTL